MSTGSFSRSNRLFVKLSQPRTWGDTKTATVRRWPFVAGGIALAVLLSSQVVGKVAVWNHTPSIPEGLYVRSFGEEPGVGKVVVFPAPVSVTDYARRTGGRGDTVMFIKPLAAGPGDHVCVTDFLAINGNLIAPIHDRDRNGIALPHWTGCRRLASDEWFTYAPAIPNSMDGRYYGPIMQSAIVGVFRPVHVRPAKQE